MLRLNGFGVQPRERNIFNSNTTNVKVKCSIVWDYNFPTHYSNTTNVKVKSAAIKFAEELAKNSNTTNVKVKYFYGMRTAQKS